MSHRFAFLGGIYSNYLALASALEIVDRRGVDEAFFLGDLGAFGPHPDRVPEILRARGLRGIQGNYEESLASGALDCNCGYTDPRDNHFAQLSYDYTAAHTWAGHKEWMGTLPGEIRLEAGGRRVLLCHGSPRKINEFLWESTTPDPFIDRLCRESAADVVICTHTGLHWERRTAAGSHLINAGVLGRPANDGRTNVWLTLFEISAGGATSVEFVPVDYPHERLAAEMRAEELPEPFVETILTGWWTTCLEVLPAKERGRGRF